MARQNIKFLRNRTVFPSLDAAKEGISSYVKSKENLDGVVILGRYTNGNAVTSIMAAVYGSGDNASITYTSQGEAKASTSHTQVNAKDGGHVTVAVETKTDASGITYSSVTVSENDIASESGLTAEINRATSAETAIDNYVGKADIPSGKTVMDIIVENEKTTADAFNAVAKAAGVINSNDMIAYTAPTKSGSFSATTSIMDMLNKIDDLWGTIDCGTY